MPAPPCPETRSVVPCCTPAGMLTVRSAVSTVTFLPWHLEQGFSIFLPVPRQVGHVVVVVTLPKKVLAMRRTAPCPLQVSQVLISEPGSPPVPLGLPAGATAVRTRSGALDLDRLLATG